MTSKQEQAAKLRLEIGKLYDDLDAKRLNILGEQNDPVHMDTKNLNKLYEKLKVNKEMESLQSKANQWLSLQTPGTEDYDTGLILKAAALRFQCSLDTTLAKQLTPLLEAEKILEPFADTPKGFFIYMQTLVLLAQTYRNLNQEKKSEELFYAIEKKFKHFKANCKDLVWNFICIFKGEEPNREHAEKDMGFLSSQIHIYLYEIYREVNNEEKKLEYAMGAIKYCSEYTNSPARLFTNLGFIENTTMVFLQNRNFTQVDHLLAGVMFHLVQYRRSLFEYERLAVIKVQSQAALKFMTWGIMIVDLSLDYFETGQTCQINNEAYEEIDWFLEPGVELYAHQFPITLVDTPDEAAKVLKRAKKWCKMFCKLSCDIGEYLHPAYCQQMIDVEDKLQSYLNKVK